MKTPAKPAKETLDRLVQRYGKKRVGKVAAMLCVESIELQTHIGGDA